MINAFTVRFVFIASCLTAAAGCGVRGRPQPPESPPEIGRGQPTFRRATEQFKFQNVPPVPSETGGSTDSENETDEESGSR